MPTYRIKPGKRHGPRDEFGPGDLVKLTEYEASGFLDKMELIPEELIVHPEDQVVLTPEPVEPPAPVKIEKPKRTRPTKADPKLPAPEPVEPPAPEEPEPVSK